jgi:hypothetical protein
VAGYVLSPRRSAEGFDVNPYLEVRAKDNPYGSVSRLPTIHPESFGGGVGCATPTGMRLTRGRPPKVRADVKRIGFRIGRPTFLSWFFASGESVVGPPADTADTPLRSGQ